MLLKHEIGDNKESEEGTTQLGVPKQGCWTIAIDNIAVGACLEVHDQAKLQTIANRSISLNISYYNHTSKQNGM